MGYSIGLIEATGDEAPPELIRALDEIGATVQALDPEWVLGNPRHAEVDALLAAADVLLVSAAIPEHFLRELTVRQEAVRSEPTMVIFTESQFGALEVHVRQGRDYLVPPFLPGLLRARLQTCYQRSLLSQSLEEAEAKARLHAYDRELQIAREIQSGFLPESLPQPDGWELKVRFHPARMVAGDFYDAFEVVNGRRIAFIVADVCDKGVGAALFMALIRSLLRHTAEYSGLQSLVATGPLQRPPESAPIGSSALLNASVPVVGAASMINAVRGTNGYLARNHWRQGYFATLFFGVLDPGTGRLVYINGGHNPPLLLRSGGAGVTPLELTGPAVGIVPGCTYGLGYTVIESGETLLVYTDGVTEARSSSGEFFGEDRLLAAIAGDPRPGTELLDHLERVLAGHVGEAEQSDDITMMTIHRPAGTSSSPPVDGV